MIDEGFADSTVYSNLLYIYRNRGLPEKALKMGKAAIHANPKNHIAYINLAYLFFDEGDYEKAREYVEKSLELKSNFLPAIRLMYMICSFEEDENGKLIYERKAFAAGDSKENLQKLL